MKNVEVVHIKRGRRVIEVAGSSPPDIRLVSETTLRASLGEMLSVSLKEKK